MKYFFSVLFIACTMLYVNAQNTLSGKIIDSGTQEPLEQVSVYFPQLERGTVTDLSGNFNIASLPKGNYKLVASYIGFQTFSASIEIEEGNNNYDFLLTPSAIEVEGVILSTPFHKLQRENVMKVEQAQVADLKAKGAVTLADGITNIAGVSTVSTGVGIGKPVIRGLSYNRVLVYTQGIRLENQQFGDEHGLGINDAGISSVEVIKGPASLLYGSDALGGVLYLNPEQFELPNSTAADINLNYFSNTNGIAANGGFKTSSDRLKFLVRGSYASHTDYSTGGDEKVTNSRFNEFDVKTGVGYQLSNFKTELRYNYNNSSLGIPEEIGEQTNSRDPELPFQDIDNHILSSKSTLFFNNSSLEAIFGYTHNNRKEFEEHEEEEPSPEPEEEEGPALFMKLNTFNYNVQYNLPKLNKLETIVGVQGMHQTNENFGEELLIPDAITNDIGILTTSHLHFKNSDVQLGLRYDVRSIKSEENGTFGEEGFIAALDRNFNSFNAAAGYKIDLSPSVTARLNLASGFRAPNLAELTSNGVHEGTNRFEIGNPDLNNERNFQSDLAFEFKNEHVEIFVNGFYNSINDFIYIEPNGEFVDSDAVFLYLQQDAELYGGEVGFHFHPHPLDWLHLESTFETVTGKLNDKTSIPLIPANTLTNTLRVEWNASNKPQGYAFLTLQSTFDQDNIAQFETETPGYSLLNFGVGSQVVVFNQPMDLRLSANNILDKAYVSHLSRLKTDGISNIGRNINLSVGIAL